MIELFPQPARGDARPIEERPQAAADRSEPGHLEGDLVIGSNNSQVATLVDRKTRSLTVVKLASRHTNVAVPALAETYTRVTPPPRKRGGFSLCWLGFATYQPGP
ncbi:hypothetical protein OHU07_43965 [Streptomyces phaeochromogenes]